jgi:hypothetical protein
MPPSGAYEFIIDPLTEECLKHLNKIFIQTRGKYFTYSNQKCYFLLWLFQLRWTLIQHFQVFHINKPNTCFAVRVISQKVMWPQSAPFRGIWVHHRSTNWRMSETFEIHKYCFTVDHMRFLYNCIDQGSYKDQIILQIPKSLKNAYDQP